MGRAADRRPEPRVPPVLTSSDTATDSAGGSGDLIRVRHMKAAGRHST